MLKISILKGVINKKNMVHVARLLKIPTPSKQTIGQIQTNIFESGFRIWSRR